MATILDDTVSHLVLVMVRKGLMGPDYAVTAGLAVEYKKVTS